MPRERGTQGGGAGGKEGVEGVVGGGLRAVGGGGSIVVGSSSFRFGVEETVETCCCFLFVCHAFHQIWVRPDW